MYGPDSQTLMRPCAGLNVSFNGGCHSNGSSMQRLDRCVKVRLEVPWRQRKVFFFYVDKFNLFGALSLFCTSDISCCSM